MSPLSIRVSKHNQNFLEQMAGRGKSKTEIVNHALDLLRKMQLQSELSSMATEDTESDVLFAEEGMEDYLTLLDHAA